MLSYFKTSFGTDKIDGPGMLIALLAKVRENSVRDLEELVQISGGQRAEAL